MLRYLELGADAGWFLLLVEMEKGFCNVVVKCQVGQVLEGLHIQHVLWKTDFILCKHNWNLVPRYNHLHALQSFLTVTTLFHFHGKHQGMA